MTVEINGDGNFVRLVVIQREDETEVPVLSDVLIKACFEPEGKYDKRIFVCIMNLYLLHMQKKRRISF